MQLHRTSITSRFILCASVIAACLLPTTSQAFSPTSLSRDLGRTIVRIVERENALAPIASVSFCIKRPEQCRNTGGPEVLKLTPDRETELLNINLAVNKSISPKKDATGADTWDVDVSSGDCEDYALTKRRHLIALGWSSASLRIAVALTATGEGHAVLIARTSKGDLILDNRTGEIKDWKRTDLRILKIQTKENPKRWVNVGR